MCDWHTYCKRVAGMCASVLPASSRSIGAIGRSAVTDTSVRTSLTSPGPFTRRAIHSFANHLTMVCHAQLS
jgi:hypothetical protein